MEILERIRMKEGYPVSRATYSCCFITMAHPKDENEGSKEIREKMYNFNYR